ncbi:Xylan alpha-(1-_2)-glucuronosidase [subsurface metagenome]
MKKSFTKRIMLWTALAILLSCSVSLAEDGYEFWLRYHKISDQGILKEYRQLCKDIIITENTPILDSARQELVRGLSGLLVQKPNICSDVSRTGSIIVGTLQKSKVIGAVIAPADGRKLKPDGFLIRSAKIDDKSCTIITGNSDRAVLYGVFGFLRLLQTHQSIENLDIIDNPVNPLRMVNHWDNPNGSSGLWSGSIERGYAGNTIFHWGKLPELEPRYKDYARMLASVGINGCVINNVNTAKHNLTGWKLLTSGYMEKMAAMAGVFRRYGVKFYVSINFASPIIIDKLETADPLDPAAKKWWADKADEIYTHIPDFGGFLIKADSEGEAGPHGYGRTHADGANILAEALKPHGGLLIWRAFVYGKKNVDRAKEALDNFHPLNRQFADNVIIQIKNGPMDFQVREPVSPLFGQMPNTNLMLELQVTQEYTGHTIHLCYLVPQWKEVLDFDTYAKGPGSTVKKILSGSLFGYKHSGITGVANIGDDRNWTSHHLGQANTYGFGRLVWNPDLSAEQITNEWVKMTFGHAPVVVKTISKMLLDSWRIYENYTSPLGVGFMCETGPHYNPDHGSAKLRQNRDSAHLRQPF